MGDTRENKTVSGSHNDIYAAHAGEGPGPELAEEHGAVDKEATEADRKGRPEARQESTATIKSADLDKER